MSLGVISTSFSRQALTGTLLDSFRAATKTKDVRWKQCGFEKRSSKRAFEEIQEFAGLGPAPLKEEMGQIKIDIVKSGYVKRINQAATAVQMPVSEEAMMFNQVDKAVQGAESIAESLILAQELDAADVFGNAFSTTLGLGPDAKPLCSATHKLPKGGTASNAMTAASIAETSLEAMLIQAKKMPAGNGYPMGVRVQKLVIPVDLEFKARRVLKSERDPSSANNTINAIKGEFSDPVTNIYLPSTTNWFGITDAKLGLLAIFTQEPDFREYGIDQTRAHVYDGWQMYGFDWVNWRSVIGNPV